MTLVEQIINIMLGARFRTQNLDVPLGYDGHLQGFYS
jgi:hypothetical protein